MSDHASVGILHPSGRKSGKYADGTIYLSCVKISERPTEGGGKVTQDEYSRSSDVGFTSGSAARGLGRTDASRRPDYMGLGAPVRRLSAPHGLVQDSRSHPGGGGSKSGTPTTVDHNEARYQPGFRLHPDRNTDARGAAVPAAWRRRPLGVSSARLPDSTARSGPQFNSAAPHARALQPQLPLPKQARTQGVF